MSRRSATTDVRYVDDELTGSGTPGQGHRRRYVIVSSSDVECEAIRVADELVVRILDAAPRSGRWRRNLFCRDDLVGVYCDEVPGAGGDSDGLWCDVADSPKDVSVFVASGTRQPIADHYTYSGLPHLPYGFGILRGVRGADT